MRAKLIYESLNFERGLDTKKSMEIGQTYLADEERKIINKRGWHTIDDFKDPRLIEYIFGKTYKKWKEKQGSIKAEDIKIWSDTTEYGNPIIKWSAPGQRQTTLLRWESYIDEMADVVLQSLQSIETKEAVAMRLNKHNYTSKRLGDMIWTEGRRKRFNFGSMTTAYKIADQLIDIMENQ
jgi:hypothetical protein